MSQRYNSYRPARKVYGNAEAERARKARGRLQAIRIENEREEYVRPRRHARRAAHTGDDPRSRVLRAPPAHDPTGRLKQAPGRV